MAEVIAFSKYLTYGVGGAEKSTLALLSRLHAEGNDITIVSVDNARFLGHSLVETTLPKEWSRRYISSVTLFPRFSYYEYMVNRSNIIDTFSRFVSGELITYGLWAPAAIIGFGGKARYYIRSETDLGIIGNYQKGIRRLLKKVYVGVEYPAISLYRRDLMTAMQRATVVANSNYMARRAKELYGIEADVVYPHIDIEDLKERVEELAEQSPKYVVFVGDSPYKGIDLVVEMADRLPNIPFRIYSRFVTREYQERNILWSPWQRDVSSVYACAALVIVPSQCEEAYGRVAREAFLLGIPLLVSSVGGLPEAVDNQSRYLVDEYRNVDAWVELVATEMRHS